MSGGPSIGGRADKITFGRDGKFDLQLGHALVDERRLGLIFTSGIIEKIELKSETWQWERTGNICIEYKRNGKPSGIATTEADHWVHELKRGDDTLVYLMFPIDRLKELARMAIRCGRWREGAGDGGLSTVALLPLRDILK
jgi:hypothetical protein